MSVEDHDSKMCSKCRVIKKLKDYYLASSDLINADSKLSICKSCLESIIDFENPKSVANVMRSIDRPFLASEWESSLGEEYQNPLREYMRRLGMRQNRSLTYDESDFKGLSHKNSDNGYEIIDKEDAIDIDNQDKKDIVRMIGYDPFEYESDEDKPHLYSDLVNFLDESTLEDGFKLQAVIEIVTGFNQIDKINRAITNITSDPDKMSASSGGIKTLVTTKKDILQSLVKLAEENGLSVKHNRQKSKGAGTLSGIIKQLQEKGIEQGELNLFDIETAKGMRQVADISNESILKQLQFDENEYTQMILEQRELIQELDTKATKLEEDNRLLKKEMLEYQKEKNEVV